MRNPKTWLARLTSRPPLNIRHYACPWTIPTTSQASKPRSPRKSSPTNFLTSTNANANYLRTKLRTLFTQAEQIGGPEKQHPIKILIGFEYYYFLGCYLLLGKDFIVILLLHTPGTYNEIYSSPTSNLPPRALRFGYTRHPPRALRIILEAYTG